MIWAVRRLVVTGVAGATLLAAAITLYAALRGDAPPPWAPLDLARAADAESGRKIAALGGDPAQCDSLLRRAGVRFTQQPQRREENCSYADALRLDPGGSRQVDLRPARPVLACPVAAGLAAWEWNVVQPAAQRHFGSVVVAIDQAGSYDCRRLYGRASGNWSEHARANALDVTGFRLADGRRITLARDWRSEGDAARFLRDVRDGACGLFATVLSPDYNAAHRDHFHLDQARRGGPGWRACH